MAPKNSSGTPKPAGVLSFTEDEKLRDSLAITKRDLTAALADADQQHGDKDDLIDILTREYHYHALRAEELKLLLRNYGMTFGDE